MKKFTSLFLLAAILLGVSLSSCKKNRGDKPVLPPKESMVQDLTLPGGGSKTMNGINSDSAYTDASIRVGVWNTVLFIGLVVPVGTFLEAFNHDPSWSNSDDAWRWKYSVPLGLLTYDCKLLGKVEGDSVHWRMYVTHDGDFEDFFWYEGYSQVNDLGGRWVMYESPTKTNELLGIYWSKNTSDNTISITYKNICPEAISPYGNNNGGYISYGTQVGAYNRFYTIYNKSYHNLTNIEWNFGDERGRIKDSITYNNNWVCWDESQQDCGCTK
jgi:hypothetical protein